MDEHQDDLDCSTLEADDTVVFALDHHPPSASQPPEVTLVSADSGPGFSFIPSEGTLFEPTKPSSSGLGLFVVRTAMANHDGTIQLGQSARLGGAEVRLRFAVLIKAPS